MTSVYDIDGPEKTVWTDRRMERLTLQEKGEARDVALLMADSYKRRVDSIRKWLHGLAQDAPYREEYTPEKIHECAAVGTLEYTLTLQAKNVAWEDLSPHKDMDAAAMLWGAIKRAARQDLAAGHFAGDAIHSARTPYMRAQFQVIREAYISDWQPRGPIEESMVETLAQSYISYNYWLEVANEAAEYAYFAADPPKAAAEESKWLTPRLSAAETVDRATAMADRYNRLFLRTLRQMRDLRRYPVVINNMGGQVNVAADGGQQTNVVKKTKSGNKGQQKATTPRTPLRAVGQK